MSPAMAAAVRTDISARIYRITHLTLSSVFGKMRPGSHKFWPFVGQDAPAGPQNLSLACKMCPYVHVKAHSSCSCHEAHSDASSDSQYSLRRVFSSYLMLIDMLNNHCPLFTHSELELERSLNSHTAPICDPNYFASVNAEASGQKCSLRLRIFNNRKNCKIQQDHLRAHQQFKHKFIKIRHGICVNWSIYWMTTQPSIPIHTYTYIHTTHSMCMN